MIVAYFSIPVKLSTGIRNRMRGKPHTNKPDADNISKNILDALFANDQYVYSCSIEKRWDDGNGARIVVSIGS